MENILKGCFATFEIDLVDCDSLLESPMIQILKVRFFDSQESRW